jgi:hypothetical protein
VASWGHVAPERRLARHRASHPGGGRAGVPALGDRDHAQRADRTPPVTHPGESAALHANIAVLARRAHFINLAITFTTVSALLVALTVVLLFTNPLVHSDLSILIAVVFVAALIALTTALLAFLIEARIATAALRFGRPGSEA